MSVFSYQVLSPFATTIYGDSFNEAIKNYIKLNRQLNITEMIVKDQMNHYQAKMNYYKENSRNKVGINILPVSYDFVNNLLFPNRPIVDFSNDTTYVPSQYVESPMMFPLSPIPMSPIGSFMPTVINLPTGV